VYEYGDFVDYSKLQRMKKHKESISSTPEDL
jgi:predicted CopG family antitoxin